MAPGRRQATALRHARQHENCRRNAPGAPGNARSDWPTELAYVALQARSLRMRARRRRAPSAARGGYTHRSSRRRCFRSTMTSKQMIDSVVRHVFSRAGCRGARVGLADLVAVAPRVRACGVHRGHARPGGHLAGRPRPPPTIRGAARSRGHSRSHRWLHPALCRVAVERRSPAGITTPGCGVRCVSETARGRSANGFVPRAVAGDACGRRPRSPQRTCRCRRRAGSDGLLAHRRRANVSVVAGVRARAGT